MLIVCNGMIRSGSTLQYNIAKKLVEETGKGKGEGFFTSKMVQSNIELFSEMESDSIFHVIKMHEIYSGTMNDENVKLLYIYRDIRDVAVSVKRKFNQHGNELIKALDAAVESSTKIMSMDNVLCQKYEDVYMDLRFSIKQQADFLGITINESIINKVLIECSIDNALKKSETKDYSWLHWVKNILSKLGLPFYVYDKDTLLHHNHISNSKGAFGVWKVYLSQDEVNLITNRYSGWLKKSGYIKL